MAALTLDEAYERFRGTGPEWGGNLSNHGPMAAEVLARHGFVEVLDPWLQAYLPRLDRLPEASQAITDGTWRTALGDFGRVGDWTEYFNRELTGQPWRTVLATWWPRLLPGIAAGATHGLIRTSHAIRTLLAGDASPAATGELAAGLAFWAARSLQVPGATSPRGGLGPAAALEAIPLLEDPKESLVERLDRLGQLRDWPSALRELRPPASAPDASSLLEDLVAAATLRYLRRGHGSPVLLVLPEQLWSASVAGAWAASAAITAAYAPARDADRADLPAPPSSAEPGYDLLEQATEHGDEHVIKFTDTAVEVYQRTGDPEALAAAVHIRELIPSANQR